MKKNNGISMITLVITIVMIIILAGITLYYGAVQNIGKTTDTMSYNEIFEVADAVATRTLMNRLNSSKYEYVGTPLDEASAEEINGKTYGEGWYKLSAKQAEDLDLENIKGEYVINYLTGEVVSIRPIYYENEEYYSSTDIRDVVGGGDTVLTAGAYDEAKGINKPILVTGMVPVRNINNKWVVTSADDEKWYDYSSENKAWANIMLMDEIAVTGYTNEDIRNASLAELEGREVTTTGSMFVWIPRYSSNSAGEIVYSNLLTDYTQDGFVVSDSFKSGTIDLTGIWMSKYDAELN